MPFGPRFLPMLSPAFTRSAVGVPVRKPWSRCCLLLVQLSYLGRRFPGHAVAHAPGQCSRTGGGRVKIEIERLCGLVMGQLMSNANEQENSRPPEGHGGEQDRPVMPGKFFTQLLVVAFLLIGLAFLGLIPQQLGLRPHLELIPTNTPRPTATITPTPTERPIRVFTRTPVPEQPSAQPTAQQTPGSQNP